MAQKTTAKTKTTATEPEQSQAGIATRTRTAPAPSLFTIPAPLRRLFKLFPLTTYPANELPIRSPSDRQLATLYVFVSDQDALKGLPSFNPSCLKWQTFLKLAGVEFRLVPSNNHASPTGALPFLLPPHSANNTDSQTPIPSSKLEEYAGSTGSKKVAETRYEYVETWQTLLHHQVRDAWLHALYLSKPNSSLLSSLYIAPTSDSQAVRTALLYQLRHAAESQILQSIGRPIVNAAALYERAEQAFEALSVALGSSNCFANLPDPGLLDAAVFSYTQAILDDRLAWVDTRLRDSLLKYPSLVKHRNRVLERCWGIQA